MKKGFKFVETIPFERDGDKCLTPCPYDQKTYLGVRYVGSQGCLFCDFCECYTSECYTSRTADTVNCMYKYKNKIESE